MTLKTKEAALRVGQRALCRRAVAIGFHPHVRTFAALIDDLIGILEGQKALAA